MKGASNIAPMGVRIPDDLKAKIQERAKDNGRSTNAEILTIIEKSLDGESSTETVGDFEILAKRYEEQIDQLLSMVKVQGEALELAMEQIALLKHHIKTVTGFDVNDFLSKKVDYEAIKNRIGNNKKPT